SFDSSFLLAMLPPGAFLGVGFMIALKNVIDKKREEKNTLVAKKKPEIERVRITSAD
ncbi:NADH-ubiquinone oxidoreductase, partial [Photobacterium profundum 3TCK]